VNKLPQWKGRAGMSKKFYSGTSSRLLPTMRNSATLNHSQALVSFTSKVTAFVEPHGQSPWHLTNAQAGRHPGQELAHSSTAKGRGFLLPG